MHIAFLNIHGNFDPDDRYWTAHPDFGGQLVYVKEVAQALGRMGCQVDILTRRIRDTQWPGFEQDIDGYPGEPNVRIVRIPCGGDAFLRKQELWPLIGTEWVPNIVGFYQNQGGCPQVATAHYGDAGLAAALWQAGGGPRYTFTAHSLGAQKLERLLVYNHTSAERLDRQYHFARRIAAECVAMNHSARIVTSTQQERESQYGHAAYRYAIGGAAPDRFGVIAPGVNLHVFDAGVRGPDDERIAAHIEQVLAKDIDPDRLGLPLVICSSRLEPKKNHIGLVLAFARSAELQAAANLMLVVRGTENIRQGMGLKNPRGVEKALLSLALKKNVSLESRLPLALPKLVLKPTRLLKCQRRLGASCPCQKVRLTSKPCQLRSHLSRQSKPLLLAQLSSVSLSTRCPSTTQRDEPRLEARPVPQCLLRRIPALRLWRWYLPTKDRRRL